MKALHIVLAVLLALVAVAGIVSAGPPRPDLDDVVWILKCVGDSLNGAACHG